MPRIASWGYLFLALVTLSHCTLRKDSDGKISTSILGPQDSGTGYGGSPPRSLVVRCGSQGQSASNTYQITCGLFDSTPDGKEFPLESLAEGESVTWLPPATLVGPNPASSSCTASNHGVTQTCRIATAGADPVTLKFDVTVARNGTTEVLSDSVMLPFVVQTFGFNPKSARNFSGGTEQDIPHLEPLILDPLQVRLQRSQLCSVSKGVFIADNDAVYLWSQGGMQVFAGSIWKPMRLHAAEDWSDRYTLPFKSRLAIDCRQGTNADDFTLYILSAMPSLQGSLTELMATTITKSGTRSVRIPTTRPWNSPQIRSLRVGPDGQWYFTDSLGVSILRFNPLQPSTAPTRFAGTEVAGDTVEATPRLSASFRSVQDLAFSPEGELFAADMLQQKVLRIDELGNVRTAVGTGAIGATLVENNPLATQLYFPAALNFSQGDLYIGDSTTSRILVLHAGTQTLSAIGGIGKPAQDINAKSTQAIAVRSDGSIWVTYSQDTGTYFSRVGRVEVALGSPSTLTSFTWAAGITKQAADELFSNATSTDPTLQKQIFTFLSDSAVDPRDGSVVIAESGNYRLLRAAFPPSGRMVLSPIIGLPFTTPLGNAPDSPDGTPAIQAAIHAPVGVAIGADGAIYFTESSPKMVKKIDVNGKLQTVADLTGVAPVNSPPTTTHTLYGIAILSERTEIAGEGGSAPVVLNLPTLAVADDDSQQVLKLTPTSAAGNYVASPLMNVTTLSAVLPRGYQPSVQAFVPNLLKTDGSGRLYVGSNLGIYRLSPDGSVLRIAGGGASSDPRYVGPALGTDINPRGMFATRDGSLYVSDNSFARIVRLDDRGAETPSYELSLIASGNDSIRKCGNGTLVGRDEGTNLASRLSTSLAQICLGMPQALAVVDRCQGPQRDFTLLFSSSVSINSSNSVLVRATRACP